MNDVEFSRPATFWPRGRATSAAPIDASDSMTAQWTPPWTMPYPWSCFSVTSHSHVTSSGDALRILFRSPCPNPDSC